MFLRRTIHFRSCAQDKTTTVFKMMRIWIKSSIIDHILCFLIFLFFWFGGILCCCLQKESFIWGVCNFLFFFIARIMNCRNYDHHSSNIYSGGLFLLTNKNLESAGTFGFQTKFRQITLSDALLTFLAIVAPSVAQTCH